MGSWGWFEGLAWRNLANAEQLAPPTCETGRKIGACASLATFLITSHSPKQATASRAPCTAGGVDESTGIQGSMIC